MPASADSINNNAVPVLTVLVMSFFALALLFFLAGEWLVSLLPTMRRFRRVARPLSDVPLHLKRIASPIELSPFSKRELQDLAPEARWTVAGVNFKHKTLAELFDLLHARESEVLSTVKELRGYSLILVVLGVVGFLRFLGDNDWSYNPRQFVVWTSTHPLDLLGLFELIMIVVFTVKLWFEVGRVARLIK